MLGNLLKVVSSSARSASLYFQSVPSVVRTMFLHVFHSPLSQKREAAIVESETVFFLSTFHTLANHGSSSTTQALRHCLPFPSPHSSPTPLWILNFYQSPRYESTRSPRTIPMPFDATCSSSSWIRYHYPTLHHRRQQEVKHWIDQSQLSQLRFHHRSPTRSSPKGDYCH